MRDYLGRFLAVPGVRAVVLAGRDGLWIDAVGRGDQRLFEVLGALGASAIGTADALGQDISAGVSVGTVLEYETALVSVDPVGEYTAFVTLCESAASLGRVRHTVSSVREDVLRALDAQ